MPHDDALAGERALYLLDYGEDLVARLADLAPPMASRLAAILHYLHANLPLLLSGSHPDWPRQLAADLDAFFAPCEWLLREVEQ
ncbi:MAG: hypothetical protein H0X24_01885 [Ktedonobacterales bacterium]|nr:hypothetical protein [Ktedonobacterales bacterium]